MDKPSVIYYDEGHAARAYEVHAALIRAERDAPWLKQNPLWTMHRQDAYEMFALAFGDAK